LHLLFECAADCQGVRQFDNPIEMAVSILNAVIVAGIAAGTFAFAILVLVPAIIRAAIGTKRGAAKGWREKVLARYQNLRDEAGLPIVPGTFAWVFAWFKLRLDPMFGELPEFLDGMPEVRTVLDIGCGYGVAGCALLEWRGEAKIVGIDPEPIRVRATGAVFGSRGRAVVGSAPEFEAPGLPDRFDAVFVLDVIHFISDSALDLTLQKIRGKLGEGGHLVIRAIIPPKDGGSWPWKFAQIRRALTGAYACYRPVEKIREMIERSGFEVEKSQMSGGNPELYWFIARARRGEK
jgi:SAM-dependent methyltransferase